MCKKILITGATDGIGLATAKQLRQQGYDVLLHGRNPEKLARVAVELAGFGKLATYVADLSNMHDVLAFAKAIVAEHQQLDVLINNAGVLNSAVTFTEEGLDIRFAVNAVAPYLLTEQLLPLLGDTGRVVNLSSAAQAPINFDALIGNVTLSAMDAYAQSKLAMTMWSISLGTDRGSHGPMILAVNPGSLLGSKMVKEGFGTIGKDLAIGVDVLVRASLADEFADAQGRYFDNDIGCFADPHPDALQPAKRLAIVQALNMIVNQRLKR